jgi:selenide,water dikinase
MVRTQTDFMGLISTGDKYAVLSRGTWALGGHSWLGKQLWVWKDRIDRKWMHMYSKAALPGMAAAAAAPSAVAVVAGKAALDAIAHVSMRCGGCGAKVGLAEKAASQ